MFPIQHVSAVKLLTCAWLGVFQCVFVTIGALKGLSRFLAISNFPHTAVLQLQKMFWLHWLQQVRIKRALTALLLSFGRQLTVSHCDTRGKAASLLTASMTGEVLDEKNVRTRSTGSHSVCSEHTKLSAGLRLHAKAAEVWSGNPLTAGRGVLSQADPSLSLSLCSIAGGNPNQMSSTFVSNASSDIQRWSPTPILSQTNPLTVSCPKRIYVFLWMSHHKPTHDYKSILNQSVRIMMWKRRRQR